MAVTVDRLGARADYDVTAGGVLVVNWRGVVTFGAAEQVKQAIGAGLPAEPLAIVSDYRRAAVALAEPDMIRLMIGGPHDMAELPAAVVAADGPRYWLYHASLKAASGGRWRFVCHDPSEAMAWALAHRHVAPARPDWGQDSPSRRLPGKPAVSAAGASTARPSAP